MASIESVLIKEGPGVMIGDVSRMFRHSDGNGSTCLANVCGRALLTRDRVDRANRMEGSQIEIWRYNKAFVLRNFELLMISYSTTGGEVRYSRSKERFETPWFIIFSRGLLPESENKTDTIKREEITMNVTTEAATQDSNYYVQHLPRSPSVFSQEGGEAPRIG
ncbi:hypothetical protein LAZ67_11001545 [Cordylochernes scorpioides]|uniref:Uncharacterized protein n=1 Tax=Cordylochernes scorpioides TaxID=51811 RepID=A0ABY6KZ01_9ARAC|nr:hypothetical protein LAZ67_11001545 [Cordylochernes scorpioides]